MCSRGTKLLLEVYFNRNKGLSGQNDPHKKIFHSCHSSYN